MYRSSLDGLTEQICALEAEKRRLEGDLVEMTRIRWPQRALRIYLALLFLSGAGVLGGVIGYRHAVVQLQEASQEDARTARGRIERCQDRLREVLTTKWASEQGTTAPGF